MIFVHARGGLPPKQAFASMPRAWISVAGPILPPANCSGAEKPGVPTPTAWPSTTDSVSLLFCGVRGAPALPSPTIVCGVSSLSLASPMSMRTLSPVAGRVITLRGFMSRCTNPWRCSSSTPVATSKMNRATDASVSGSGVGSKSSSAM